MAATEFALGDALAVQRWSNSLAHEAEVRQYFRKFMGKGPDALIKVQTELNKQAGEKITVALRMKLSGDGIEGDNAIAQVRTLMGATDPQKSPPGSIRGDFGMILSKNIVHGSDKPESAKREISLFFTDEQLMEYKRINEDWLY